MDITELVVEWSDKLTQLEQNPRIDEGALIRFAKERGIPISGSITGDPSKFNELGWLPQDGSRSDCGPLYHPFRLYTLHRILLACRIPIAISASINRDSIGPFVNRIAQEWMPKLDRIGDWSADWNRTVSLCILLEPVYWPQVTDLTALPAIMDEIEFQARLETYSEILREQVAELDPDEWEDP